jgi:hypothetical protein
LRHAERYRLADASRLPQRQGDGLIQLPITGGTFQFIAGEFPPGTDPDLDSVVYCGDAANATAEVFYHCDNANGTGRATDGIYLQLPESRGMFVRGFDPAHGYEDPFADEEGANREIGQLQDYALEEHCHETKYWTGAAYVNIQEALNARALGGNTNVQTTGGGPQDIYGVAMTANTTLSNTPPTTICPETLAFRWSEYETRPINLSFRMCIRY